MDIIGKTAIDVFLASSPGSAVKRAMDTVASVQKNFAALVDSEDSDQLKLLKIGTVFQIFLIDALASRGNDRNKKLDWKSIAENVSQYAILEEGQLYSEFVFSLYADYIDISAKSLDKASKAMGLGIEKERTDAIRALSTELRDNSARLRSGQLSEGEYVEAELWIALEAMVKLLSSLLASALGDDRAQIAEAASDLAFEYGRYVLYAREQAILEEYIQNQNALDDELRSRYDDFLAELRENAERFQWLIDGAFSPDIHDALMRSADLARASGVKEEELLSTIEDIDDYFTD